MDAGLGVEVGWGETRSMVRPRAWQVHQGDFADPPLPSLWCLRFAASENRCSDGHQTNQSGVCTEPSAPCPVITPRRAVGMEPVGHQWDACVTPSWRGATSNSAGLDGREARSQPSALILGVL